MQYITLSHQLEENSPVHFNLRKPKIVPNSQITKGDGYNSFIITAENHSGTHIDTSPDVHHGILQTQFEITNNPHDLNLSH